MNLLPDAAPQEQNVDVSDPKKLLDNQDLLPLLKVIERTYKTDAM